MIMRNEERERDYVAAKNLRQISFLPYDILIRMYRFNKKKIYFRLILNIFD